RRRVGGYTIEVAIGCLHRNSDWMLDVYGSIEIVNRGDRSSVSHAEECAVAVGTTGICSAVELAVSSECEPVVRSIRSADILYVGVFSGCDRDLVEVAVVPVEAV